MLTVLVISYEFRVPTVSADNVTTSVYVLNTPPVWTTDAQESTESSATIPTNSGSVITWTGTGTDSNNDSYYLLICKTSGAPTANSGAPPTCNGGISNRWAVSSLTASAAQATAATTTKETFPFENESNAWYAWICDGNASLAQCNATGQQGSGNTASPFFVNHPPVFSAITNDGPISPYGTVTWTATAYDTDTARGTDTVSLIVCKAADFNGFVCGAGGTWATSTMVSSNPATSTSIEVAQDKTYAAYVYVTDQLYSVATSTNQGSNSSYVVLNVRPTVSASGVTLIDTIDAGDLDLFTAMGTSGPFQVQFTVTDNNSCLNASSGNEISLATSSIYRSGVGSTSCILSGHYNSNNCYPYASSMSRITCSQTGGTCGGATDSSVDWTCNFSLWYNADPTDAATQYTSENWLATVQVTDDNASTSILAEATTGGKEVTSFMAFDVSETTVALGGLQPGQFNDPLSTTTTLVATGNVGLDQDIYGDTMCPGWTAPDSCDTNGVNAANDIPISNQKVATSSVAYGSAFAYSLTGSTSPTSIAIHVPKTTSTSSPQSKFTYWGINVPIAITLAGSYLGQDTITAVKSSSAFW